MSVLRRLGSALIVIWLAVTLAFVALRVLPGDALSAELLQSGASAADIDQRRAQSGLVDSLPVQYLRYLTDLLRGDLGASLLSGQPVTDLIARQLPPTLTLAASALLIAVILGLLLGVGSALDVGWGLSAAANLLINLALATPIYWTGTLAIFLFAVLLNLLPAGGSGGLDALLLPAGLLGYHTAGSIAQVTAAGVRETRIAEFVRVARAKGLRSRIVVWRHILRVSLLPVVTVIALQAGFLLSGAVITESLFVRPGVGRLLLDSTLRQDYPVVQGIVILAAVTYVIVNTLADGLQRVLDPRLT